MDLDIPGILHELDIMEANYKAGLQNVTRIRQTLERFHAPVTPKGSALSAKEKAELSAKFYKTRIK